MADTVQKLTCEKLTLTQYVPLNGNKFDQYNGLFLMFSKLRHMVWWYISACLVINISKEILKNKNRIIVYLSNATDVWPSDDTAQIYQYLDN